MSEVARDPVAHAVADRAVGRLEPARDAVEQRRLAGAGFADDRQDLAGPQVEVDARAADARPVAPLEVADGEDGIGAHRVSPDGEKGRIGGTPGGAIIGVGAHEHAPTAVVGDDLVEVDVPGSAERAGVAEALDREGMVLEIEAAHVGEGRQRVDPLLAAGPEELQGRGTVHLGIVEFRQRRRIHDVAARDLHRIGVGRGDVTVPGDVLVELHVHEAVFLERVHRAGLGLARLEVAQRLGDRHLVDDRLAGRERRLRDAVACLDDRGLGGPRRGGDAGGLLEEGADRHRVGGVVGALVDHLQHVVGPQDRGRHLNAAGAPAVGHRHLARREGHLIAGDRDGLEDGPADHPLRALVEIGEIIGRNGRAHGAASDRFGFGLRAGALRAFVRASPSARRRRTRSSSAWKST